jgi:hypothetical protein
MFQLPSPGQELKNFGAGSRARPRLSLAKIATKNPTQGELLRPNPTRISE